jgi:hypothetical protein
VTEIMAALRTCTDGAAGGEAEAAMGTAAAVGAAVAVEQSAAEVGSPVSPLGELVLGSSAVCQPSTARHMAASPTRCRCGSGLFILAILIVNSTASFYRKIIPRLILFIEPSMFVG